MTLSPATFSSSIVGCNTLNLCFCNRVCLYITSSLTAITRSMIFQSCFSKEHGTPRYNLNAKFLTWLRVFLVPWVLSRRIAMLVHLKIRVMPSKVTACVPLVKVGIIEVSRQSNTKVKLQSHRNGFFQRLANFQILPYKSSP